ncbi:TPA: hypothetical protein ACG0AR_003211 [Elizabethkingia anophelis]|uniref:hypothetical protein n=1 Tax=Elizabethkingia anophelis TaxID=1117645 RepID=UPI001EE67B3C|nr:hypothetical protein [Elizabethkingia anophelis]
MRKKLLYASLWGVFALSLLSSCRTEDGAITQKQVEDKRFAVFTPRNGKTVNYADGFAYLMKRYDKFQKTNLSGINNKHIIGNLNANTEKNASVFQSNEPYIEFNVPSETMTKENGDKWVAFPKVKGGKVIGLVTATLVQNGTYVKYNSFGEQDEWYKQNVSIFQEALNQYQQKSKRLNLSAGINPMASGDIQEVIIIGRPKPRPNNPRPNWSPDQEPMEGGGSCDTHEDCAAPDPGGSGGDSGTSSEVTPEEWAKEHIDDKEIKENECINEVYEKLKSKPGVFNTLLDNFRGNSILDLKLRMKNVGVVALTEIDNVKNGIITISFNPEYAGATELGRASTFVHEMFHAYMTWQLVEAGWDGEDTAESYKSIDEKNLPDLLKAYKDNFYNAGISEHEFISQFYIPKIITALKEYDPNLGTEAEYQAIAWNGLQGTEAFKNKSNKDTLGAIIYDNVKKEPCGN